ncbi:MAG TPA: hypothetical protein VNB06_18910 [Thermoanaerobaculia bacterium]|nr:hypothetical protein [Thermoanaerobaculia bacterium]
MRVALLVVLLALGVAVAAVLVLVRPPRESVASASPPASVEPAPTPVSTAPDLVLPSEPPRAEEASPEPAEPPAEPVAEAPLEPQPVDFEAKYAGRDFQGVSAALLAVKQKLEEAKVKPLVRKLERGDVEVSFRRPGEPATSGAATEPDPSTRLEMSSIEPNPDGTLTVKRASMRPEEDPDVLALWQEEQWLIQRKNELRHSNPPKKP